MSYFRILLVPVALAVVLLASGAAAWSTLSAPPPPTPAPAPPAEDAEVRKVLDLAVAALAPGKVGWLEMKIWQRAQVQGLAYEAEGRYLRAADRRFRLDLRTRVGQTPGSQCVVCDGASLWQATRVGDGPWQQVLRLNAGPEAPAPGAALAAPTAEQYVQTYAFSGPHPLLQGLSGQLVWVKQELVKRGVHRLVKLTGAWSAAAQAKLVKPGRPWPDGVPRQCRLYLEPETLWPHRIEWWGPDAPRVGEQLLMQLEFREPALNRALSEAEARREFSFDPGAAPVQTFEQLAGKPPPALRAGGF